METEKKSAIVIETTVKASMEKVWRCWTEPEHIKNWCFAIDTWHAPEAENNLVVGGKFRTKMAAKDGSVAFDFEGVYSDVKEYERIKYQLGDERNVEILFSGVGNGIVVTETFDPENSNPIEMQRGGWQAILDNFKKYVESIA